MSMLRDGLVNEGEELVSTGCDTNGQWACIGPKDRCGWQWSPGYRTIRLGEGDLIQEDLSKKPLWPQDTRTQEQKDADWAEALRRLEQSGRRWVVCRKQLGDNVKWGDPGFMELYESIK